MVSFTITVGKGHEISVESGDLRFWREPLVRPFGFKGGYLTELWQAAVTLRGGSGEAATGLGTQSVLWSDAEIFASRSEAEGNELMLALTRRAVELASQATMTRYSPRFLNTAGASRAGATYVRRLRLTRLSPLTTPCGRSMPARTDSTRCSTRRRKSFAAASPRATPAAR